MKSDADVALGFFNRLRAFDAKASKEASQAASLKARRDVERRHEGHEGWQVAEHGDRIEPLPLLLAMK